MGGCKRGAGVAGEDAGIGFRDSRLTLKVGWDHLVGLDRSQSRGWGKTQEGQAEQQGVSPWPSMPMAIPSYPSTLLGKPRFVQMPTSLEGLQQVPTIWAQLCSPTLMLGFGVDR